MNTGPTTTWWLTMLQGRVVRLRERLHSTGDRGAFSIEMAMIVAGLVVVAGIVAAVLLNKVNEKTAQIG